MQWVKIHCLIVICATTLVSLFIDATLPFFPIEISRIASSGKCSQQIFKWGITSIFVTIIFTLFVQTQNQQQPTSQPYGWLVCCVWLGTMIAAWFTDKQYFAIHTFGVLLIVASVFAQVYTSKERLAILLLALFIQGLGICIKGYVIWFVEFGNGYAYNPISYVDAILSAPQIVQHTMQIMFTSVEHVEETLVHGKLSLACFQVGGIMQWMALYLMSCLF